MDEIGKAKQLNLKVFLYFAEIEFIDGSIELFKGATVVVWNYGNEQSAQSGCQLKYSIST